MTADEAEASHAVQIGTFAETEADQVTITMTNGAEATDAGQLIRETATSAGCRAPQRGFRGATDGDLRKISPPVDWTETGPNFSRRFLIY